MQQLSNSAHKFDKLDDFLKNHKLPQLTQNNEIYNFNCPTTVKEFKFVI